MALLQMDKVSKTADPLLGWSSSSTHEALKEETFIRMIAIERKRTERSGEPFLLMLLAIDNPQDSKNTPSAFDHILSVLPTSIRETDIIGWYKHESVVGVMFTGLAPKDKSLVLSVILGKVSAALREKLTSDQFNHVSISLHFFPDNWDQDNREHPSNPALYPDLFGIDKERDLQLRVKQLMDIAGSALLLFLCFPLFLIIAAAIKLSSNGPVLFRQQRIGQYGRCFTFLKFRSMHASNDHSIHKEYVTKLIAGAAEQELVKNNGKGIYKLTNDKRITKIGKFLRRTSLDELPQLINVLKGDMSLVGPRPALPYELAAYQTWHRRRVLGVKPGITGLWQVTGRSSVRFDEMVRLDLRYSVSWSPWLDFKILMRTPRAVIQGAGAC